jgi:signal transduction histidine kinase
MRLPIERSIAAPSLRTGKPQRFADIPEGTVARERLGARTGLVTPMMFRNRPVGFLSAFDRTTGDPMFTEEDERLLQAFAASAATAVATAQEASNEALRRSVRASEQERMRWARELHDETLQELAGLKVLLSSARRASAPERLSAAVDDAIELVGGAITNLRALITDLRPAALDELGTVPAVEALVDRVRAQTRLDISLVTSLAYEQGNVAARHTPEIEIAVYRLVQEGLTNVVKHAEATQVVVEIADPDGDEGFLHVEIRDDGKGFDPADGDGAGFGLIGMRERLALVDGELQILSAPDEGTTVIARIPVARRSRGTDPQVSGVV